MGAVVLVAARIDAERRAKEAELEVSRAKRQTTMVKQDLHHIERRLRHSQRALSRVSERSSRQEEEIVSLKEKLGGAASSKAPMSPRPAYVSLQWARDAVLHWMGDKNVGIHLRVGAATIAAAAALWLCRGVFLMWRGLWRWSRSLVSKEQVLQEVGRSTMSSVTVSRVATLTA